VTESESQAVTQSRTAGVVPATKVHLGLADGHERKLWERRASARPIGDRATDGLRDYRSR
jgi:hypothetical protein